MNKAAEKEWRQKVVKPVARAEKAKKELAESKQAVRRLLSHDARV